MADIADSRIPDPEVKLGWNVGMKLTARSVTQASYRPIAIASLLTLVAFVCAVIVAVWTLRYNAIDAANESADQVAEIMAEEVRNSIQSVEIKLHEVIDWSNRKRDENGNSFDRFMTSKETHDALFAQLASVRQAVSISIADGNGKVLVSTRGWPVVDVSVAHRSYFKAFKDTNSNALYISEPYYNLIDNSLSIAMTKPIRDPSGAFLGTASIFIDPANFIPPQKVITSFRGRQFTLTRTDGVILTRMGDIRGPQPQPAKIFDRDPVSNGAGSVIQSSAQGALDKDKPRAEKPAVNRDDTTPFQLPRTAVFFEAVAQGGGIFKSTQALDPRPSWIAFRPVSDYPIVVAIATLEDTLLATWRAEAIGIGIGTAGFIGLFIVLLRLLFLQFQRNSKADARFGEVLQHMSHGVAVYNDKSEIETHNLKYEALWGLEPGHLNPGTHLSEIAARLIKSGIIEDLDFAHDHGDDAIKVKRASAPVRRLKDGRSIRVHVDPMPDGGWIAVHEDITTSERAAARIRHLANHDSLTNLANRSQFLTHLQQRLDASLLPFVIFLIDLDHFKDVNDAFGHGIGDELLRQVSHRLNDIVRVGDVVARLGGDEFAIILSVDQKGSPDIVRLVETLIPAIQKPYRIDGNDIIIGLSVGITEITSEQIASQDVMRQADLALYQAKQQGRNQACFFEEKMEAAARSRRELAIDLQGSIARGELVVYYQPIVDAKTCEIRTMEALVRWPHPTHGLIPPNEFIGLAEESGLIHKLGEFVMRRACKDVAMWPHHVKAAVNVSVLQATQPNFPDIVATILAETGLAPGRLQVEITESILIMDGTKALAMFHALHGLGVEIVLDDFGTGYSSLSYLNRFPFDEIKVDKSFVDDIMTHEGSAAIISATTMLARTFHVTTTAEGVETREQLEMLRAAGVDQIQGYLFARPAAADHWTGRFAESTILSDRVAQ